MSIGDQLVTLEFTSCLNTNLEYSMQNRYFAYFSNFSHIGVDFRILICEFAYAWRPCYVTNIFLVIPLTDSSFGNTKSCQVIITATEGSYS